MARRKRKEEEPVWTPPEFDEVGYMRQEMEAAKASTVTVAWAVAGALVSFALFAMGQPVVAFFAGLLVAVGLYWAMPALGVRTRNFKRKDWVGHGMIYFFSWLAFWILLINAPLGDFTSPVVQGINVGAYDVDAAPSGIPAERSLTCLTPSGASVSVPQGSNDTLYVLFRATDNAAVSVLDVRVNGDPATAESVVGLANVCRNTGPDAYSSGTYALRIPISGAGYDIVITATDATGRSATGRVTITVT